MRIQILILGFKGLNMTQCWPVVSNTNHTCHSLCHFYNSSNLTVLLLRSKISLTLPLRAAATALAIFAVFQSLVVLSQYLTLVTRYLTLQK